MSGRILIRAAILVLLLLPSLHLSPAQNLLVTEEQPTIERSLSAVPGWTRQISDTRYTCHGVSFIDNANGMIVGEFGEVLCTTDGGEYWRHRTSSNLPYYLYSITMVNARLAFATANWSIARTTDAGYSWTTPFVTINGILTATSFCDSVNGCAVGLYAGIFRTTDAGEHWVQQSIGTRNDLYDVEVTSPQCATAVGDAVLLQTTDGGTTWIPHSGVSDTLRGVSFTDAATGTIVGMYGSILRTTDGGKNWRRQSVGVDNHFLAVSFSDTNHGTAVGWCESPDVTGIIFRTTDGGAHWTKQAIDSCGSLLDVHMTDEYTGTAVGSGGIILRTTTGGVTWVKEPKSAPTLFHLAQNYPNPVTTNTTIPFTLSKPEHVRLSVCDVLGREVAVLVDEARLAGNHSVAFNTVGLRAGIYFSVLRTRTGVETNIMLVMNQTAVF